MRRSGSRAGSDHASADVPAARVSGSALAREGDADHAAARALALPLSLSKANGPHGANRPVAANPVRGALPGSGTPLPETLRGEMEQRFGEDFSAVRVASSPASAALVRGFGARAFAHGEQLAFAPGEFAPATNVGRQLIAHELAHVVQQRHLGRAEFALQMGVQTPNEQALDLMMEMNAAPSQGRAEVVKVMAKVLALAASFIAALSLATGGAAPATGPTATELRKGLMMLANILFNIGEDQAGMQIAIDSKDAALQSLVVSRVVSSVTGVTSQQKALGLLGTLAGQKIAPAGTTESSTQWLESRTPAIGKTFAALDRMGITDLRDEPIGQSVSEQLLGSYFTQADHDILPDSKGQVAGMARDVNSDQIEADCDVYATYGARLLREQGWETAGYMVMVPDEKDPHDANKPRSAHAVALAKKPNTGGQGYWYRGVSNQTIRELSLWSNDANVLYWLQYLVEEIYDPPSKIYSVYYLPALAGGAYDRKLLDPKANNLTPFASRT